MYKGGGKSRDPTSVARTAKEEEARYQAPFPGEVLGDILSDCGLSTACVSIHPHYVRVAEDDAAVGPGANLLQDLLSGPRKTLRVWGRERAISGVRCVEDGV